MGYLISMDAEVVAIKHDVSRRWPEGDKKWPMVISIDRSEEGVDASGDGTDVNGQLE